MSAKKRRTRPPALRGVPYLVLHRSPRHFTGALLVAWCESYIAGWNGEPFAGLNGYAKRDKLKSARWSGWSSGRDHRAHAPGPSRRIERADLSPRGPAIVLRHSNELPLFDGRLLRQWWRPYHLLDGLMARRFG